MSYTQYLAGKTYGHKEADYLHNQEKCAGCEKRDKTISYRRCATSISKEIIKIIKRIMKNEISEDYPLGGMIEPYDIVREQEFLEELEKEKFFENEERSNNKKLVAEAEAGEF